MLNRRNYLKNICISGALAFLATAYPATQQERAWSSPIWYTPDPRIAAKAKYEAIVHGVGSKKK